MPKKKAKGKIGDPSQRKQRTREHIIEDLSVNHVERLAMKCGFVVRRQYPDYGLDLKMQTIDELGRVEGEQVSLQIKATDAIHEYELAKEDCFSLKIDAKDYRFWTEENLMPVFLILYDAKMEEAFWLHVQDYHKMHQTKVRGKSIKLRIPRTHVLGVQTMRMMRRRKQELLEELNLNHP